MSMRRTSEGGTKPTTQEDVAVAAGVSTATVSHVLSGRTDRVSEATRGRVLEAIRKLGYKAPPADLRSHGPHTGTLGLLSRDLGELPISRDAFFPRLLDGAMTACLMRGWGLTIMADRMWGDAGQSIRRVYDGRCDGILAMTQDDETTVTPFVERGVPVVTIGKPHSHELVSSVDVDNVKIGSEAANLLVQLGHRRLGFIGRGTASASRERMAAFQRMAEALGAEVFVQEFDAIDVQPSIVASLPFWRETGCTAIFCWVDYVACYLSRTLGEQGLKVPDDMSIIGVDDSEVVPMRPILTTFRQPLELIGRRAVEILLEQIESGKVAGKNLVFEATLIQRKSVGPPRNC